MALSEQFHALFIRFERILMIVHPLKYRLYITSIKMAVIVTGISLFYGLFFRVISSLTGQYVGISPHLI
jgi:hypothetical protein